MENDKEAHGKKLGEVIKKAWDDETFMQRLLEDATSVLKEHGIQLPEGMKVKAVTNSEKLTHLVVPPKPSTKLSDEDLDRVAAGGGSICDALSGYGDTYCGSDFINCNTISTTRLTVPG